MTMAWVLGGGGLLGSALCRTLCRLGTVNFSPSHRLVRCNEGTLAAQLTDAVHSFVAAIDNTERWEVYWAVGNGTMGSPVTEFSSETRRLSHLLQLLEAQPTLTQQSLWITQNSTNSPTNITPHFRP
ncbi:MAG: hypothetical protein ACRESZ_15380, partial [Methylococcales bacterium]